MWKMMKLGCVLVALLVPFANAGAAAIYPGTTFHEDFDAPRDTTIWDIKIVGSQSVTFNGTLDFAETTTYAELRGRPVEALGVDVGEKVALRVSATDFAQYSSAAKFGFYLYDGIPPSSGVKDDNNRVGISWNSDNAAPRGWCTEGVIGGVATDHQIEIRRESGALSRIVEISREAVDKVVLTLMDASGTSLTSYTWNHSLGENVTLYPAVHMSWRINNLTCDDLSIAPVPEPGTMGLIGIGSLMLVVRKRRK